MASRSKSKMEIIISRIRNMPPVRHQAVCNNMANVLMVFCCRQDEVVDWWVGLLRSVSAWNMNNMELAASLYSSIDALPQIYQV